LLQLFIAGALDFADALTLVKLRGELMEKAYPSGYGMGVITGLTEQQLDAIINQVSSYKHLYSKRI
jgi:malonate decarboxylase epsilon subunit